MLDYQQLKKLAIKQQTQEDNVIREYLQNLFLSFFYSYPESESFLFKGGTALRLVYQSPRFSEDLDFSGLKNGKDYEKILLGAMRGFLHENINCELMESKPTSGGWLAQIEFSLYGRKIRIKNEISFRKREALKEVVIISSDFIPPYKVLLLAPKLLIEEKLNALLGRQKVRDVFDLYFILRDPYLRKHLQLDHLKRQRLVSLLKNVDPSQLKRQLKPLLPFSFASVIESMPNYLINVIEP